jgi:hypothetical protein
MTSEKPFVFAGLWDRWARDGMSVETFTNMRGHPFREKTRARFSTGFNRLAHNVIQAVTREWRAAYRRKSHVCCFDFEFPKPVVEDAPGFPPQQNDSFLASFAVQLQISSGVEPYLSTSHAGHFGEPSAFRYPLFVHYRGHDGLD